MARPNARRKPHSRRSAPKAAEAPAVVSQDVSPIRLGVNVDHAATVRQARGTTYPDPVEISLLAAAAGADSITLHLREDRRHIQDHDLERLMSRCPVPVNLEMVVLLVLVLFVCCVFLCFVCLFFVFFVVFF